MTDLIQECEGCGKSFSCKGNLAKHHRQKRICKDWVKVGDDHIYDLVQSSKFSNATHLLDMMKGKQGPDHLDCVYCGKLFANSASLSKHLQSSVICDKWRQYNILSNAARFMSDMQRPSQTPSMPETSWPISCDFEKKADWSSACTSNMCDQRFARIRGSDLAPFTPSPYHLCHIIWNIFIFDKEAAKKDDFQSICQENQIEYLVGLFPQLAVLKETISFDIESGVLVYSGHDSKLDLEAFDEQIAKMENLRAHRKNVAIICNSGFQRSIPFLVYYLTKHHSDEIPTIARAIDIILPQVDKERYATTRDEMIESVTKLFASNNVPP